MKLYNFRDLGGLTTTCNREIKTKLLYRTGNVAHWSDAAAAHVANNCGVKLYIDFRSPDEVQQFGRPEALVRQRVEWLPISIDTSDANFEKIRLPKAHDWLGLYQRLLEKNIPSWTRFAQIVSTTNEPILYGCLFGKDRTGIATSLLLNLLDVHDKQIVVDYVKTTHEVQPLAQLFQHMLDNRDSSEEELFEHFSRSRAEVMIGFLEYLRTHPDQHSVGQELQSLIDNFRNPLKTRLLKTAND